MAEFAVFPKGVRPTDAVVRLADSIAADGGARLAAYREPIGGHWQLFALIPTRKLEPTPFQRGLSPAHMKRLTEVIKKLGRFTEPVVVVRSGDAYWTPNGNHRCAAALKLGGRLHTRHRDARN